MSNANLKKNIKKKKKNNLDWQINQSFEIVYQ